LSARSSSAATTNRLLTGSADTMAKLWDVETGKELFNFPHKVRRHPPGAEWATRRGAARRG